MADIITRVDEKKRWYVVQTKPRCEAVCRDEFLREGIDSCCPMTREYRIRRRCLEIVPLFPGYIFGHFSYPNQYDLIRWKKGVSRLVTFGGNPPVLGQDLIDLFRNISDPQGIIDSTPQFQAGDAVRFKDDRLEGLMGTILRIDSGKMRALILLNALSYQARIEVETYQLQAV